MGTVRPLALALIRRGDQILVETGRDESRNETFYRLLGGTIEFGERGAETVRRELLEELGAGVEVDRLVTVIENVFTWEDAPRHEIVLVYECRFTDPALLLLDEWQVAEAKPDGIVTHRLCWKGRDDFRGERLYPEELLALLPASVV